MQRIYFIADRNDQLVRVPADALEALWDGRGGLESLDCDPGEALRLITAIVDENLNPVLIFFIRVDLDGGEITPESRLEAYDAVTARGPKFATPAAQKQFVGWPNDWPRQMAVALDTPVAQLNRIALGGPLLMSDLWGVPVEKVVEYFEGVSWEELS